MSKREKTQLIVVVSGGGPVGLTFSLNLAMMMCKKHVKIIIYESRWFVDKNGIIQWQNREQGNIRREQIVTLQDHVIQQMPLYVQRGLFQRINERVWPTSRNIPIREVEDRLLDLIRPFVQNDQVKLIPEQFNELSEQLIKGDFDILVGADGSNSFVRRYCNIQLMSEGIEYACGVAYNIPANVPSEDESLHQALNCILTVSQTRFLVNSSASRRGYLNVRLTRSEYEELRACLQIFENSKESLNLVNYKQYSQPSVWSIIRQGLHFFNIRQQFVYNIIPIEIDVRHASIVVRELRFEINKTDDNNEKRFKTILACLAGDAAMNVHFWPGRGMNSGMKAAIALARNIVRACTIQMPLHFNDLLDYEGFMARLRAREQQGRSLRILVDPIDKSVDEAYIYSDLTYYLTRYKNELRKKLKVTRQLLQERPGWPHKTRPVTDKELDDICNRISQQAVAQLSLANPWPTREMSGIEILVEDTFPFSQNHFLSVPRLHKNTSFRTNHDIVRQHYRSVILWIIGDKCNGHTMKLMKSIRTLLHEVRQKLDVVNTIKEAAEWMRTEEHRENIRRKDVRFKVVTSWFLDENHTAVDVIRTIRAVTSHTPILVIPNKHEDTRLAREFPNVATMNTLFDLYEFLEINQATQWNEGYRVSHAKIKIPETKRN